MASPYDNWAIVDSPSNLGSWFTDDAYNSYLADMAAREQLAYALPKDQWRASFLADYGLDPSVDESQYTATTRQSENSNWGGLLNNQVVDASGNVIFDKTHENGGMHTPGDLALAAAITFGGAALGAGMAGAGAGAGAGTAGGLGELGSLGASLGGGVGEVGATLGSSFGGGAAAIGGGVGGIGAGLGSSAPAVSALPGASGAGGLLGSGAGGLASAEGGVTALGSAWSPASLGLEAVAPAVSAGEMSALGSALPSIGSVGSAAGGLSSADKAAMLGGDGYGAGMTGAQTSAYDSILGATGSKGLADVAANSGIGSGLLNGVKGVADVVGGGQNLAGIIGAIGGALDSGGTDTATRQFLMDPRMDQYVYGTGYGDTNSFLGAAQQNWQQNKTGINPTMQQGLDMQRAALQDPAYGQAFTQMRNVGTGLLNQPMAGNPFSSPQGATAQAGGPGGLLGGNFNDRAKALMASGRGLLG